MYLVQSQSKIGVKCSSCRVRGQKSKLNYRYAEIGTIKVKTKTEKERKNQEYLGLLSLLFIFFVLKKGKEKKKNSLLFFSFSLLQDQWLRAQLLEPDQQGSSLGLRLTCCVTLQKLFTSQYLSFLIHKMGMTSLPISWESYEN